MESIPWRPKSLAIFKKRRTPQHASLHVFRETRYRVTPKDGWFVTTLFLAWRISVFFKWILKLKFFLKQIRYKFSKIQISPMELKCKYVKTKNARMGKGRGGSRTFLVSFTPYSKLLKFKNRTPLFFYRFHSFIRKSQSSLFNFFITRHDQIRQA